MNILVVTGFNPYSIDDGNACMVKALLRELVSQGHKVVLLSYAAPLRGYMRKTPPPGVTQYLFPVRIGILFLGFVFRKLFRVPAFYLLCSLIYPFRKFPRVVRDILVREEIEVIQCENIYTVPPVFKCAGGVPIVLAAPDVLWDRYAQSLEYTGVFAFFRKIFLKSVFRMELRSIEQARVCVCVSEADRSRFIEMGVGASKIEIVPNGVDCDAIYPIEKDFSLLKKLNLGPEDPILFFGGSGQLQNIKAVEDIITVILPEVVREFPSVRVILAGGVCSHIKNLKISKLLCPNIIRLGYVDNLISYYGISDIVILPITLGSGTKLKAVEALAAGKPVISTPMGVVGYDIVDGRDVVIEKSLAKFPAQIARLLKDHTLRSELSLRARKAALKYDWKFLIKKYDSIYKSI